MLHRENLNLDGASYEVRHDNNGNAIHVLINKGFAVVFPSLSNLIQYEYLGENSIRSTEGFYVLENQLNELYEDTYDYESLKAKYGTKSTMYARKFDATGEGMNSGYCFGDGEKYFKYVADAIEYSKSIGYPTLDDAYDDSAYYWTEWEDEAFFDYVLIDGKLIEL